MVTPVLLFDLILLFCQEVQLLVAALHVLVQAIKVVTAPLGVVLRRNKFKWKDK